MPGVISTPEQQELAVKLYNNLQDIKKDDQRISSEPSIYAKALARLELTNDTGVSQRAASEARQRTPR